MGQAWFSTDVKIKMYQEMWKLQEYKVLGEQTEVFHGNTTPDFADTLSSILKDGFGLWASKEFTTHSELVTM